MVGAIGAACWVLRKRGGARCGSSYCRPARVTSEPEIFQSLKHAIVAVRPNGIVLEANGAALQLLGFPAVRTRRGFHTYAAAQTLVY